MKPEIRIYICPCSDIINIAGFGITHCDTDTAKYYALSCIGQPYITRV